jgi:HSP20 family protein
MNINDIINCDWFKRFFGCVRNNLKGKPVEGNMVSESDAIEEETGRRFRQLKYTQLNPSKESVREYKIPEGGRPRIREVRPLVYGYSMTFGFGGRPRVRQLWNLTTLDGGWEKGKIDFVENGSGEDSPISDEREPLVDVNTTDKEVKVVMEILGVKKEDIKINAYDEAVEVTANSPERKYHKTVELPPESDIETARSRYNNGILEITFDKKNM